MYAIPARISATMRGEAVSVSRALAMFALTWAECVAAELCASCTRCVVEVCCAESCAAWLVALAAAALVWTEVTSPLRDPKIELAELDTASTPVDTELRMLKLSVVAGELKDGCAEGGGVEAPTSIHVPLGSDTGPLQMSLKSM